MRSHARRKSVGGRAACRRFPRPRTSGGRAVTGRACAPRSGGFSRGREMGSRFVIRTPLASERRSIEQLALLDDRRLPGRDLLVAEVDGELWAAVVIDTGEGVADPFRPSGDVMDALRAAAMRLRIPNGAGGENERARVSHPGRRYLRRGRA